MDLASNIKPTAGQEDPVHYNATLTTRQDESDRRQNFKRSENYNLEFFETI